jgi:hypothetical protein
MDLQARPSFWDPQALVAALAKQERKLLREERVTADPVEQRRPVGFVNTATPICREILIATNPGPTIEAGAQVIATPGSPMRPRIRPAPTVIAGRQPPLRLRT